MNFLLSHRFRAEIPPSGAQYLAEKYDINDQTSYRRRQSVRSTASVERYAMASPVSSLTVKSADSKTPKRGVMTRRSRREQPDWPAASIKGHIMTRLLSRWTSHLTASRALADTSYSHVCLSWFYGGKPADTGQPKQNRTILCTTSRHLVPGYVDDQFP